MDSIFLSGICLNKKSLIQEFIMTTQKDVLTYEFKLLHSVQSLLRMKKHACSDPDPATKIHPIH